MLIKSKQESVVPFWQQKPKEIKGEGFTDMQALGDNALFLLDSDWIKSQFVGDTNIYFVCKKQYGQICWHQKQNNYLYILVMIQTKCLTQ